MISNHYLNISVSETNSEIDIDASDGVFSLSAHVANREEFCKYCDKRANQWLNSELGNYSVWRREHRRLIANKWLAAKYLSEGKHDYYFNLKSRKDIFSESVAELAKEFNIEYQLIIK